MPLYFKSGPTNITFYHTERRSDITRPDTTDVNNKTWLWIELKYIRPNEHVKKQN